MPRIRKTEMQKILTLPQLQGIGLVAAHWNSLEFTILHVIAKTAGIKLGDAAALCGSQNMGAWCEILRKLIQRSDSMLWKEPELKKLCEDIGTLQRERNHVVHAFWQPEDPPEPGLLALGQPIMPRKTTALGFGIPKRGLKTFISIETTAAEMRATARRIAETESKLLLWVANQTPPTIAGLISRVRSGAPRPRPNGTSPRKMRKRDQESAKT